VDVTTVLKDQHADIRRAFWRAAVPGRRRDAEFRRLVRMLVTHETAEQVHVHPAARRTGRMAAAMARAHEEEAADQMLARLWRIGPYGAGYLRCLRALRRSVLAHAAMEEAQEIPGLGRLSRGRRWLLGQEVRLARELAPTRPHPRVTGALANRLAMPVLGPADRVRDLIHERSTHRR